MGKKRKEKKEPEDKHLKFIRVVTPRVKKALKAIALVGNQSGTAYEYTEDDVIHIIGRLSDAVLDVKKRYMSTGKQEIEFSLGQ